MLLRMMWLREEKEEIKSIELIQPRIEGGTGEPMIHRPRYYSKNAFVISDIQKDYFTEADIIANINKPFSIDRSVISDIEKGYSENEAIRGDIRKSMMKEANLSADIEKYYSETEAIKSDIERGFNKNIEVKMYPKDIIKIIKSIKNLEKLDKIQIIEDD